MRRGLALFSSLLVLAVARPAVADDYPSPGLALVSPAGASINNLTTASPFTIPGGAHVSITCPRAFYYATGKTSTTAAVAAGDFPWSAATILDQDMNTARPVIAILPQDGAAMTCYLKYRVR